MWLALDVLHVICTRLRTGQLSMHVGDGSQHSEEIVKISICAFQCDYYIIIIIKLLKRGWRGWGRGEEMRLQGIYSICMADVAYHSFCTYDCLSFSFLIQCKACTHFNLNVMVSSSVRTGCLKIALGSFLLSFASVDKDLIYTQVISKNSYTKICVKRSLEYCLDLYKLMKKQQWKQSMGYLVITCSVFNPCEWLYVIVWNCICWKING